LPDENRLSVEWLHGLQVTSTRVSTKVLNNYSNPVKVLSGLLISAPAFKQTLRNSPTLITINPDKNIAFGFENIGIETP